MILSYILTIVLIMIAGHFKGRLDAIADDDIKGAEWFKKYDFTKPGDTKHWWTGDSGGGYYCDTDVYNWIIEYRDKFGQNRQESGHVTLIR
jgi:hypothetical protein